MGYGITIASRNTFLASSSRDSHLPTSDGVCGRPLRSAPVCGRQQAELIRDFLVIHLDLKTHGGFNTIDYGFKIGHVEERIGRQARIAVKRGFFSNALNVCTCEALRAFRPSFDDIHVR